MDGGGKPDERLGLARLPWGQLTGLRADLDGVVETKWLTNYGKGGVRAIAAIEKNGFVQAEILDQYGNVIPGWSRKESQCRILEDDHGKLGFFWEREDLVGRPDQAIAGKRKIGRVVKLRFYLHKAALYGLKLVRREQCPLMRVSSEVEVCCGKCCNFQLLGNLGVSEWGIAGENSVPQAPIRSRDYR